MGQKNLLLGCLFSLVFSSAYGASLELSAHSPNEILATADLSSSSSNTSLTQHDETVLVLEGLYESHDHETDSDTNSGNYTSLEEGLAQIRGCHSKGMIRTIQANNGALDAGGLVQIIKAVCELHKDFETLTLLDLSQHMIDVNGELEPLAQASKEFCERLPRAQLFLKDCGLTDVRADFYGIPRQVKLKF